MLGGVPSSLTTSGDAGGGDVLGSSSLPGGAGGAEDSERVGGGGSSAGNRWPRDETLSLLKIRSDMDVAFRDSSLKGPLWEEVSRKMAELGFQRNAKKCKEKFENVYKYHKRTKDGRGSKSEGKTYRFFDQLEAFETAPPVPLRTQIQQQSAVPPLPTTAGVSVTAFPANSPPNFQQFNPHAPPPPPPIPNFLMDSDSTSSTSSDQDIQRRRQRRGKKRKWKEFFKGLMRDVIDKQEQLQKTFLESLETREREQMAREEAWRAQEIARINREHEILAQERSAAAAKDAAVIAFLQKVADQHNLQIPIPIPTTAPPPQPNPPIQPQPQNQQPPPPPPPPPPIAAPPLSTLIPIEIKRGFDSTSIGGSGEGASSSRWPKSEIQALIQLRMNLETKYQEGGPKGPLWEEVSAAMGKLGYWRSAKRCKEKWENINKYFKKVKESNRKRPEDSKTCPYYHLLDAIYKEKAKLEMPPQPPIMALPEQQWPQDSSVMPPNRDHNQSNDNTENFDNYKDEDDVDEDDYDNEDDSRGGGGGDYEIVANAPPPPPPAAEL